MNVVRMAINLPAQQHSCNMAIIKPYLSSLAQIILVAPLALVISAILSIANILYSFVQPRALLTPKTILITGMYEYRERERR